MAEVPSKVQVSNTRKTDACEKDFIQLKILPDGCKIKPPPDVFSVVIADGHIEMNLGVAIKQ